VTSSIIGFRGGEVLELANSGGAWRRLSAASNTPFVRSLDDFDRFVRGNEFRNCPLARLTESELAQFRSKLQFDEARRNGIPYRLRLVSFYYGDLIAHHEFTRRDVEDVAAVFGIGPAFFAQRQDYFGDFDANGNNCCRPRTAYFCGDFPDCPQGGKRFDP